MPSKSSQLARVIDSTAAKDVSFAVVNGNSLTVTGITASTITSATVGSITNMNISGGSGSFAGSIVRTGNLSAAAPTVGIGPFFATNIGTYTDTSSANGATISIRAGSSFNTPTFASTNPITVTNASTLYISNPPTAGTNTTLTNRWALYINNGSSFFNDGVTLGSAITSSHIANGRFEFNGPTQGNIVSLAADTLDLSQGNFFTRTINANTTFSFTNPPTGKVFAFTLELTHTSGTVTWPAAVRWPRNTAPTLTTGRVHLFTFITDDAGAIYRGSSLVDYSS